MTMSNEFPHEIFVITTALGQGQPHERDYVLDSTADKEYAQERARKFAGWRWPGVRLRRLEFHSYRSYEQFLARQSYDRYKIDDWQSDFTAY